MNKFIMPLLVLLLLMLSACGGSNEQSSSAEGIGENTSSSEAANEEMRTYQSENGPVEVPENPERVVVLSTFAGNVLALDVPVVGVDSWSKSNPQYDLEGVEEVTDESLEKIIELNPDLIIGLSNTKNIEKLKEIAPTVTFTYGKLDYLEQHKEIGKLLNKEEEAKNWIEDFQQRAQAAGDEIKAEIGEDATVTVIENFDKELYVFGDNWARGTEILYQEMGLNMPDKVKETALDDGYYSISPEVLPEYVGDYLVVSKNEDTDTSFMQTQTYKNMPAVQNDRVFEANAKEFYFNDPITLEHQLEFFKKSFLNK
ncbi:iron complex transport system substrate-binding protein [Alteribacillus persepolensis]|uniref:Iron complex transport system substrate-binding protein n=1 Tax=Alteribacillus persepolensis TaxID=568899 RepID=A0A1G8EBG8_9BACI|nr:iron-hydroxamate ABC transporter substrate-binding protein [Alteribacillus persepolensis]SDH67285.1 iron complex transport system substrate-binding protein [Alteribacillus persepolensis]